MHRFYASSAPDGTALLDPQDWPHACRVLRLREGDPVEIFADSRRYEAVLIRCDLREGVRARLLRELPSTEARLRLTLFQGLPRGERMDLIVQKAVELGCDTLVPVRMMRSVMQVEADRNDRKLERWRRIAREACKQSGRTEDMRIPSVMDLKSLDFSSLDACAVPWEEEVTTGPLAFARAHPRLRSLGLIIGPEGGIDRMEMDMLRDRGCHPLTLGPRILRTETAGLAAVSVFMALYGEMEEKR